PEVVKLDLALVRGVDTQPARRRLLGSMTAEFKKMGTLVVAEGVETRDERDALTDMGCDLLQGFLLGRPETLSPSGTEGGPPRREEADVAVSPRCRDGRVHGGRARDLTAKERGHYAPPSWIPPIARIASPGW